MATRVAVDVSGTFTHLIYYDEAAGEAGSIAQTLSGPARSARPTGGDDIWLALVTKLCHGCAHGASAL
jgi:hypothetical protein